MEASDPDEFVPDDPECLFDNVSIRKWNGSRFKLLSAQSSDIEILADEVLDAGDNRVGELHAIVCAGRAVDLRLAAGCLDDKGSMVIDGILGASDALATVCEDFTFVYIGNLMCESRGRRIGLMLLHELAAVAKRMKLNDPLFCWYACPAGQL